MVGCSWWGAVGRCGLPCPLVTAASPQLVGEWHILRWMGIPMIPGLMMTSPPPPQATHPLAPFWMEPSKDSLVIKVKLM